MAAFSDYAALQATLAGWVHRSDVTGAPTGVGVTDAVQAWITLFEAWANRKLRDKQMEKRASAPVSTEYAAVPSDMLQAKSMVLTDGTYRWALEPASQWVLDHSRDVTGFTGRPRFYAIVGAEFRLFPAPDKSYTLDLTYYAGVTPLSTAAPSNWLLAEAPDAYLYGALLNGAPYLRDMTSVALWKQLRDEAMAAVIESDRQPTARLRYEYAEPPGKHFWNVYSDS